MDKGPPDLLSYPSVHLPLHTLIITGGLDSSYWTYPITTTTTLPGWKAPTMLVQRRFRDFVALSSLLSLHLPGYFLPQRPHRNAIEGRRATPKSVGLALC
jgi:hypothetical protein